MAKKATSKAAPARKRPAPAREGKHSPAESLRRARLAGLLLETLISQSEGLPAAAKRKLADAARLLAEASQALRAGAKRGAKAAPKRAVATKS